ncbi:unnamed protein product [Heligmosomoides polygyrus]|uniref:Uncharacterized protein n=1 Tax=Heligmosomoides polygyrus TaxID=6339 RepID=A0A183FFG7_HELPZ|nr:unnamed protein product [Heligmosomoides polygyrus]
MTSSCLIAFTTNNRVDDAQRLLSVERLSECMDASAAMNSRLLLYDFSEMTPVGESLAYCCTSGISVVEHARSEPAKRAKNSGHPRQLSPARHVAGVRSTLPAAEFEDFVCSTCQQRSSQTEN